jgi:quercetin dioxygenase-like cupin family protein
MNTTEPETRSRHPRKVAAGELIDPASMSGVVRLQAFADEKVWVGAVINRPREMSGWHVHPGHDTYAYFAEGRFRVEYGPGGRAAVEFDPGDFAHVPAGIVHREGNPGDSPNKGIAFRIGDGPVVVDLEGPEAG